MKRGMESVVHLACVVTVKTGKSPSLLDRNDMLLVPELPGKKREIRDLFFVQNGPSYVSNFRFRSCSGNNFTPLFLSSEAAVCS